MLLFAAIERAGCFPPERSLFPHHSDLSGVRLWDVQPNLSALLWEGGRGSWNPLTDTLVAFTSLVPGGK